MAQQQQLFETEPAPWELDAAGEQLVATVVFPEGPEQPFDYKVPDGLREAIGTGRRVQAPFGAGNRMVEGYCVRLGTRTDVHRRLKPLAAVIDHQMLLSPTMLRLTGWMADYYLCPLGQVLEAVLPAGVRSSAGTKRITLLSLAPGVKDKLEELKLGKKQLAIVKYMATSSQPLEPRELARAAKCTMAPITARAAQRNSAGKDAAYFGGFST